MNVEKENPKKEAPADPAPQKQGEEKEAPKALNPNGDVNPNWDNYNRRLAEGAGDIFMLFL